MGRVEVCLDGRWGTVCGESAFWGANNALVVCRQLFGSASGEFELVANNLAKGDTKMFLPLLHNQHFLFLKASMVVEVDEYSVWHVPDQRTDSLSVRSVTSQCAAIPEMVVQFVQVF